MGQVAIIILKFILLVNFIYIHTQDPFFLCMDSKFSFDFGQQDTCVIEGMNFEMIDNGEIQDRKAVIKNGRIRIVTSKGQLGDYRVIRYVFSIRRDEKFSSVRNYGDLVSFPVINLLKESEPGDQFYFEDIIIVDLTKTILNDAVKPLIIKRL